MDNSGFDIDKFVKRDYAENHSGKCKILIEIAYESRINYDEINFSHKDLKLNYCFEVFRYYKENNNFSVSECSRLTGISSYHISKIYKKYLKYSENGKNG